MSASLKWCVVDPNPMSFKSGISKDYKAVEEIFGNRISTNDRGMLRAMHAASGLTVSLWSEIYDVLTNLPGDDPDAVIEIEVWVEY